MASSPRSTNPTRPSNPHRAPVRPSGLRQSFSYDGPPSNPELSPKSLPQIHIDGDDDVEDMAQAGPSEPGLLSRSPPSATESTALLRSVLDARECSHADQCNHGTFSPRPGSPTASLQSSDTGQGSGSDSNSSAPLIDGFISSIAGRGHAGWRRKWARKMRSMKMSTSSQLAERHGVEDTTLM